MKKVILGMFVGIALMSAFSFKVLHEIRNTTAEAIVQDSLVIFTDAKPLKDYTVIGNVRLAKYSYNDDSYIMGKEALIEKCKKTYPTAEGLIFTCKDGLPKYAADVITFKK